MNPRETVDGVVHASEDPLQIMPVDEPVDMGLPDVDQNGIGGPADSIREFRDLIPIDVVEPVRGRDIARQSFRRPDRDACTFARVAKRMHGPEQLAHREQFHLGG